MMGNSRENRKSDWIRGHAELAAFAVTLLGLVARLWTASGTFLNPDEALHFRLANQVSMALAYKAGLTAFHPPLLTLVLHFWRAFGASELWLRLPSVLAGAVFCWMFYKWLGNAAGSLAGFIGLLFVALLPPVVLLAAEVRQYALLLAFLASSLYFLDEAFAKNSTSRMAAFSLCLCLAMLSHYSAFLFATALGIYVLLRIFTEHSPARLVSAWAIGQLAALALALFLYETHVSKLGAGKSTTAPQGWTGALWTSELHLHRSYFDRAHDNPIVFLAGHTFGVFQYFFGQLAVGDAMGLLFVVGVVLLLRGKGFPAARPSTRPLGLFLLLPFAIAGGASLAHVYPYGGTRHLAFLVIPGVAGVSVAIARLAAGSTEERWARGLAIAALVIAACIAFVNPRPPRMDRADQSRTHMAAAMEFIGNIHQSDLIVTDYQTDLIVGHYLCRQRPVSLDAAPVGFEQFFCGGHRVVSTTAEWVFSLENFPNEWQRFVQSYRLRPGTAVWILQAGWGVDLLEELQRHFAEFHDVHLVSFGGNIKIFKLTVGQPMPAAVP
jgi:4-amino-4-deoxy-L-arabinose transferase-like glycosyltransferase